MNGIIRIADEQNFRTCREVAAKDGLLIGGSAGLNLQAARVLSGSVKDGSMIATVFPDSGIKYLSKIFNEDWLVANKMKTTLMDDKERV